jgi:hypothetical protein
MKINSLLKKDKGFFKATLEDVKVIIEITKSAYSSYAFNLIIDF